VLIVPITKGLCRPTPLKYKRIKRDSQKLGCTAGHTSFAHPTALLPNHALWNNPRSRDDRSVDDDDDGSVDDAEDADGGDCGEDEAGEEDFSAIALDSEKQLEGLPNQPVDSQSLEIFSTMKKQIEELSKKTSLQAAVIESLKTQLNFKRVEMHRVRGVTKKPTAASTTLPTLTPSATKKAKDAALKRTIAELLDEYAVVPHVGECA
jgi:hypothetical protein